MKHADELGRVVGYCNACGDEVDANTYECCEGGEIDHYEDCDCEECIG